MNQQKLNLSINLHNIRQELLPQTYLTFIRNKQPRVL